MPALIDLLRSRLTTLLPSELKSSELRHLLTPVGHPMLLCQRRAMMIVDLKSRRYPKPGRGPNYPWPPV